MSSLHIKECFHILKSFNSVIEICKKKYKIGKEFFVQFCLYIENLVTNGKLFVFLALFYAQFVVVHNDFVCTTVRHWRWKSYICILIIADIIPIWYKKNFLSRRNESVIESTVTGVLKTVRINHNSSDHTVNNREPASS